MNDSLVFNGGSSGRLIRSRGGSGASTPGSPHQRPVNNISPMRSRASTTDEESVKLDKVAYQHMFHDIVSIKTMLLKLKRVLSESEGNLVENGMKLLEDVTESEEIMDLRRQVMFLQQQLEEREKRVHDLQAEVGKKTGGEEGKEEGRAQCNAATQTDRLRPVSTGPSIVQDLPSDTGNLVSDLSSKRCVAPTCVTRPSPVTKNGISHDVRNTRSFVAVQNPPQCDQVTKIMEKVKQLSFKPVDPVVNQQRVLVPELYKQPNVFKITKIDLVLKSDNYGKKETSKT